jgi:hypothetical protein
MFYLGASMHGGAVFLPGIKSCAVRLKGDSNQASTTALMVFIWGLCQVLVDADILQFLKSTDCVVLVTASELVMQAANLPKIPPNADSDVDRSLITGCVQQVLCHPSA